MTAATHLLLVLAYFVAGKLGLTLAFVQPNATTVWPPTGIAIAAFLLLGPRVWPAIALGAFLVNITTAGNFATSVAIAAGNTLEGALGAYLVGRYSAGVASFQRPQDVLRFAVLAGVASTVVSPTLGVTTLSLAGYSGWEKYGQVWLTWWLGDMAGALIVAPFVILWLTTPRIRLRSNRALEAAVLGVLVVAFGAAVFGRLLPESAQTYALDFMAVPPLLWAAFRFGPRETVTAALALACIALWGTLSGEGPFARASTNEALLLLQTFVSGIGLVGLLFAALVSENREAAQAKALEPLLRFEKFLSELLAGLIRVPESEIDASLERGLRRVVAFLGVDRGNLDEFTRNGPGTHLAEAGPGVGPGPGVTDGDRFPWTAARLRRGEIVRFARVDELPEEATADRAGYVRAGTRSKVALPLRAGGQFVGALSFGSVRREREWPDELVERLGLLGEAFASALERKRIELSRAEGEREVDRLRQDLAHIGRISALGELTASLAHELNQPLTAILSNAQAAQRLLGAAHVDLAEIREILGDIANDDKRAGEIIRRLRALVTKGELERKPLEIGEVVSDVARLVRGDAVTRGVSVSLECAAGLPRVRGDRVQLQQVVLNLVLNALEAMRAPTSRDLRLVIRTLRVSSVEIAVEVQDSGAGICLEDAQKLFEPLYTSKPGGLGMGLAIARTIVEAHRGRLTARNNPNTGATFRFTLPVAMDEMR